MYLNHRKSGLSFDRIGTLSRESLNLIGEPPMGIPTPSKRRRTRTANAIVRRDESLVDQRIAELQAQQEAIVNRQGTYYEYVSPYLGASFAGHFRSEADFLAHVEYREELIEWDKYGNPRGQIHQVSRRGKFRGRYVV
jgi:hypothetical protein